jgi:HK97 family phage major capsid protein
VEEKVSLLRKDGATGAFRWQLSVSADEPATFAGKRWYAVAGLPDPSTAGVTDRSVIFGDIRAVYMVADRQRITVKRSNELYSEEGKIGFKFLHRVGGGVIRPPAVAAYLL